MLGLLITFEGVEGSGKTTQLGLLADRLQALGWPCCCTREPGGTPLGQNLRELLLHKIETRLDPLAELLLYTSDRAQHISEIIRPALQAGQLVLCDRHTDSTLAYQGYGRGLDLTLIEQLNAVAIQGIRPDLTFWLRLSPEQGLTRAYQRLAQAHPDRMEQTDLAFHHRIAAGFAQLAQAHPDRIQPIRAEGSPNAVAEQVWQMLTQHYPQLKAPPP